jgi:hypothetical protein
MACLVKKKIDDPFVRRKILADKNVKLSFG